MIHLNVAVIKQFVYMLKTKVAGCRYWRYMHVIEGFLTLVQLKSMKAVPLATQDLYLMHVTQFLVSIQYGCYDAIA